MLINAEQAPRASMHIITLLFIKFLKINKCFILINSVFPQSALAVRLKKYRNGNGIK